MVRTCPLSRDPGRASCGSSLRGHNDDICTRLILVGDCTFYVYIKPYPVRFSAKVLFCSVLEDSDRTRPRTSSKVASWPMLRYTFTACVTRVIVFVRY